MRRQPRKGILVKLVHVGLQVPELAEDLSGSTGGGTTSVEFTFVATRGRLVGGVGVSAGATTGFLAAVTTFVGAEVAELREGGVAAGDGADVGLFASVAAEVDFEVGGLTECFAAVGEGTAVFADLAVAGVFWGRCVGGR